MKAIIKKLFTFSLPKTEQVLDKQNIVELVKCPLKELMCKKNLAGIYKNYIESEFYRNDKNYEKSIDSLKNAFSKSTDLMDHPCTKCTQHFRQSIITKLADIHEELGEKTKGFFGDKNYLSDYLKAGNVLEEFKSAKYMNSIRLNEANERFLGNFLN